MGLGTVFLICKNIQRLVISQGFREKETLMLTK